MTSLIRCLWSAAHQWRRKKRDFKLMKMFLQSPEQRYEIMDRATHEAQFLMLALMEFASSDLQVAKVKMRYTISDHTGKEFPIPPPMASYWGDLIWFDYTDAKDGTGAFMFPFVTEKGILPIYVEQGFPKLPESGGEDLMQALAESSDFIFSKTPLPLPGSA